VSTSLVLIAVGVVTFLWLFFMLADYGWERKKCRGLDVVVRPNRFGMRSEKTEYEWYSWIRYLAITLLTYVNAVGVIDSGPQGTVRLVSPIRMFWASAFVILFSILFLAIDGYWDRRRRHGLSIVHARFFWSYFWLRYPVLISLTVIAAKRGLRP
jgi:glycosyltransferase involved in cell wall biosynthesis